MAFRELSVIKIGDYTFPNWTHILGEFMTASTIAGFFFWAVWMVINVWFFKKKVKKYENISKNLNFYCLFFFNF